MSHSGQSVLAIVSSFAFPISKEASFDSLHSASLALYPWTAPQNLVCLPHKAESNTDHESIVCIYMYMYMYMYITGPAQWCNGVHRGVPFVQPRVHPWDGRLDLDTAFVFRVSTKTPAEVSDALGLVEVGNMRRLQCALTP